MDQLLVSLKHLLVQHVELLPMRVYSSAGILLLIVVALAFMYGHQGIQEYQTLGSQVARGLSSQHQNQYEMYSMAKLGGGVIAVLGLGELLIN